MRGPLSFFLLPRDLLAPLARRAWLRATLSFLLRPAVAVSLWLVVLVAWHVPALYEAALEQPLVHRLEHLSFVVVGLLVWTLIIDPSGHRRLSVNGRIGLAVVALLGGPAARVRVRLRLRAVLRRLRRPARAAPRALAAHRPEARGRRDDGRAGADARARPRPARPHGTAIARRARASRPSRPDALALVVLVRAAVRRPRGGRRRAVRAGVARRPGPVVAGRLVRGRRRARRRRAQLAARDDRDRVPRPLPPAAERDDLGLGAAAPADRADAGDASGARAPRRPPVRVADPPRDRAAGLARRVVRRPPRRGLRRRRARPVPPRARARLPDRDRPALLVARALRRAARGRDADPDRLRLRRVRPLGVPRARADVLAARLRLLRVAARAALGDRRAEGSEPRRDPHVDRAGARLLRRDRLAPRPALPRGGRGGVAQRAPQDATSLQRSLAEPAIPAYGGAHP